MPSSDLLHILLTHDRWATRQILTACESLTDEQFHQRFEIGPGSLHDTLTHILGAMQIWIATLAGREPGPRLEEDGMKRTLADLLALLKTKADELAAEAHRLPLSEMVTRVRQGKSFQFTRAAVLGQVTTHGMHHRAQCLNMLRQLGVKPLPPSSVIEWVRMGEAAE